MANDSGASSAVQIPEEMEKRRLQDLILGTLVVLYRTVVLVGGSVYMIVKDGRNIMSPLGWALSLALCMLLCFWSQYINQFLLDPPMTIYDQDPSILVLLALFTMVMVALPVSGGGSRPLVAAAVLSLDVLLVSSYFGWCVANLVRHARRETT